MEASYILPIRRTADEPGLEELADYLRWLSDHVEVIVADGSDRDVFVANREAWAPRAAPAGDEPATAVQEGDRRPRGHGGCVPRGSDRRRR